METILQQLETIITATVPALFAGLIVLTISAIEIWFRFKKKDKKDLPNV